LRSGGIAGEGQCRSGVVNRQEMVMVVVLDPPEAESSLVDCQYLFADQVQVLEEVVIEPGLLLGGVVEVLEPQVLVLATVLGGSSR